MFRPLAQAAALTVGPSDPPPAVSRGGTTAIPAAPGSAVAAAVQPVFPGWLSMSNSSGELEYPPPPPLANPVVEIEMSTTFVPLNANNTNGSAWKRVDGVPQVGLPQVRDKDATFAISAGDPELKQVTVRVTKDYHPRNYMAISVNHLHPNVDGETQTGSGGAQVWRDNKKTRDGTLPAFYGINDAPAQVTCFVEGLEPSSWVGDVFLTVQFTIYPVPDSPTSSVTRFAKHAFTVTPIVKEFSVTTKPSQSVTLLQNQLGSVVGLNSGNQSALGGAPGGDDGDANRVAAVFTANLDPTTNMPGTPEFLQVVSVTNGSPAGVYVDGEGYLDRRLLVGGDFPVVDSEGAAFPFLRSVKAPNTADRVQMLGYDTPYMTKQGAFNLGDNWINRIRWMDVTFSAVMHLVWHYPDGSIYTLASGAWDIVFRADTPPGGILTVDPSSVVTGQAVKLPDHTDPARVVGPNYNGDVGWVGVT